MVNTARKCRVARFYTWEDSCQAQEHQRCITCGAFDSDLCRLTQTEVEIKIAIEHRNNQNKVDGMKKSEEYAKDLVKKLWRIEEERYEEFIIPHRRAFGIFVAGVLVGVVGLITVMNFISK